MNFFRKFSHWLFSKCLTTACHPKYGKRHHEANKKAFELSFYRQKPHRFSSVYFPSKKTKDMQFIWMLLPLTTKGSWQIPKITRNLCLGTDPKGDRMPLHHGRSLILGGWILYPGQHRELYLLFPSKSSNRSVKWPQNRLPSKQTETPVHGLYTCIQLERRYS